MEGVIARKEFLDLQNDIYRSRQYYESKVLHITEVALSLTAHRTLARRENFLCMHEEGQKVSVFCNFHAH